MKYHSYPLLVNEIASCFACETTLYPFTCAVDLNQYPLNEPKILMPYKDYYNTAINEKWCIDVINNKPVRLG